MREKKNKQKLRYYVSELKLKVVNLNAWHPPAWRRQLNFKLELQTRHFQHTSLEVTDKSGTEQTFNAYCGSSAMALRATGRWIRSQICLKDSNARRSYARHQTFGREMRLSKKHPRFGLQLRIFTSHSRDSLRPWQVWFRGQFLPSPTCDMLIWSDRQNKRRLPISALDFDKVIIPLVLLVLSLGTHFRVTIYLTRLSHCRSTLAPAPNS
jgi:hypothetical protein